MRCHTCRQPYFIRGSHLRDDERCAHYHPTRLTITGMTPRNFEFLRSCDLDVHADQPHCDAELIPVIQKDGRVHVMPSEIGPVCETCLEHRILFIDDVRVKKYLDEDSRMQIRLVWAIVAIPMDKLDGFELQSNQVRQYYLIQPFLRQEATSSLGTINYQLPRPLFWCRVEPIMIPHPGYTSSGYLTSSIPIAFTWFPCNMMKHGRWLPGDSSTPNNLSFGLVQNKVLQHRFLMFGHVNKCYAKKRKLEGKNAGVIPLVADLVGMIYQIVMMGDFITTPTTTTTTTTTTTSPF